MAADAKEALKKIRPKLRSTCPDSRQVDFFSPRTRHHPSIQEGLVQKKTRAPVAHEFCENFEELALAT